MNTSTSETCPRHIWMHEVEMAAIKRGVDAYSLRTPERRDRMNRAYNAGEPVWMMVDELVFVARQRAIEVER